MIKKILLPSLALVLFTGCLSTAEKKAIEQNNRRMINSIQYPATARLKYTLDRGADPNLKDQFGVPVLFRAIAAKKMEHAKMLLDRGADIHAVDQDGETVLYAAVATNDIKIVDALIKKGVSVNVRNKIGKTPAMEAARLGYFEMLKFLIDKGADINARPQACSPESTTNTKSSTSSRLQFETVLQYAIWANDYECVRMILDAKPDVSDPKLFTKTLDDNKIDDRIFEALLAAGVDPNYTEPDEKETYAISRWDGVHVKKLRALVNHPKFDTSKLPPLVVAVLKNDLEQIQAQVKAGADVNAEFKGKTPIGIALDLGNLDAFKCMLHSPRGGEKKQVLLNMSCETNQPEFVKLLLALPGIDVNGEVDGHCAIHRACYENSVECLKLLLAMPGIDVNKRIGGNYFHKRTPLQCAESRPSGPLHECIRLLREAGATQ